MKRKIKLDWLFFFRFSTGFFALMSLFAFWSDLPKMLFDSAYIKPELSDVLMDDISPTTYSIYVFSNKYFLASDFDSMIQFFIYLYIIALLFLTIGLFTRFAAVIALLLQIIIYKSMNLFLYGADFFLTMLLFYCLIFPRSKLSLDYLIFKFRQNPISVKWSLLLLQIHICIIYFFSGLDKALGSTWWNGEALWKASNSHNYNGLINLGKMNLPDFVFILAGMGAIIIEFLYPLFINLKTTRKFWISLVIMLHLLIAIFMGLYMFALIMIILNLAAFYFPFLEDSASKS